MTTEEKSTLKELCRKAAKDTVAIRDHMDPSGPAILTLSLLLIIALEGPMYLDSVHTRDAYKMVDMSVVFSKGLDGDENMDKVVKIVEAAGREGLWS